MGERRFGKLYRSWGEAKERREGSCGVLCVVGLIHAARFTVAAFPFEGGKSNVHGPGSRSDTLKSAQGCS